MLHGSHLHENDGPTIAFRRENKAHSMHPDSLHAGEDGIFPEYNYHELIVGIYECLLNRVAGVFLAYGTNSISKFLEISS